MDRVHIYTGKVSEDRRYNSAPYRIEADISVEIDVGQIIRWFGLKAARNKAGRSRCLSGMVKVKAENVKKTAI